MLHVLRLTTTMGTETGFSPRREVGTSRLSRHQPITCLCTQAAGLNLDSKRTRMMAVHVRDVLLPWRHPGVGDASIWCFLTIPMVLALLRPEPRRVPLRQNRQHPPPPKRTRPPWCAPGNRRRARVIPLPPRLVLRGAPARRLQPPPFQHRRPGWSSPATLAAVTWP